MDNRNQAASTSFSPKIRIRGRKGSSADVLDEDPESEDISFVMQAIKDGSVETLKQRLTHLQSKGKTPQCLNTIYYGKSTKYFGKSCVHFAVSCNQVDILKILFEYKANPNVCDESSDPPLYCACDSASDIDISAVASTLLDHDADIAYEDEHGNTLLHIASRNGHVKVLEQLLDKLKSQGKDVVDVISAGRENDDGESPLHLACKNGHLEVAQLLLKYGAKVDHKDNTRATPLHEAASSGFEEVVVLLIKNKATINTENWRQQRPLDVACQNGQLKVVLMLLSHDAKVGPGTMRDAISSGNEDCARAIINSDQREEAMRQTYQIPGSQKETTPFRELIKNMPKVAKMFLDLCCTIKYVKASEQAYVTFDYQFVEDFGDTHPDVHDLRSEEMRSYPVGDEQADGGEDYIDGGDESDTKYLWEPNKKLSQSVDNLRDGSEKSWGPTKYDKSNHPLSIMVQYRCLDLLKHPLIGSLLHHKWKVFGFCYFLNLLWYILFLVFLTVFALLIPSPVEPTCMSVISGTCDRNNSDTASGSGQGTSCSCSLIMSDSLRDFTFAVAILVIILSSSRLAFEIGQFCILRLNYMKDWVNWIEVAAYICSIVFVWVFHTECLCPFEWQWQFGVVAVFLAWITLLIFVQKFPQMGIYVLMFLSICYTFLKAVILFALLVFAFSLTFYMIFFEPQFQRSPFSSPGRAILKAMTMTTGDFDFDSLFRLSPNGEKEGVNDIPFPAISVILWMIFIILMPILLTNMLVGLAVDDIKGIQEAASLEKLTLQVNLILSIEEVLPNPIRIRFADTRSQMPLVNTDKEPWYNIRRKIQYILWGGECYDTYDIINKIRHSEGSHKRTPLTKASAGAELMTTSQKRKVPMQQDDLWPSDRAEELKMKLDELEHLFKSMQAKFEDIQDEFAVTKID